MKFTKVAEDAFKKMQLNAGVLLRDFDPEAGALNTEDIVGATSGGVNFKATPEFTDLGEDVDNVPNNTKELKKLARWDVALSGTFLTVDHVLIPRLIAAADVAGDKVTPRADLLPTDFEDIWWVGDYSDVNDNTNGGFLAIHMFNGLSTGGFQLQSGKEAKGHFAFEFTGHYSILEQDKVPFEVYVKAGA